MLPDDPRIDAAIDSYPITPLPHGFIHRTMRKINPVPVQFQLHFLDLAIPAFFITFLGTLAAVALWTFSTINPIWFLRLERELDWIQMTQPALIPAAMIGLLLFVGVVFGILSMILWLERGSIPLQTKTT